MTGYDTKTNSAISPLLLKGSKLSFERKARIRELNEEENKLIASLPSDDPLDPNRRKRVLATWPEIIEQPQSIKTTLEYNEAAISKVAERIAEGDYRQIYMVGCGDSLTCHNALQCLFETLTFLSAHPIQALDFAYYPPSNLDQHSVVICLSSSGKTPRTVEALYTAQSAGAFTIALTNTAGSTLDQEAEISFSINATRIGWPTQSSTSAMAVLAKLAVEIGLHSSKSIDRSETLFQDLNQIPRLIESIISGQRKQTGNIAKGLFWNARKCAQKEAAVPTVHFSAAGPALASAIFGAAKLRECTPLHGQSIHLEEFHHYTSVKPGENLIIIAPNGPSRARALDTARHASFWGASPIGITMDNDDLLSGYFEQVVQVPFIDEMLSPFLCTIPLQMLAVQVAECEFEAADFDT